MTAQFRDRIDAGRRLADELRLVELRRPVVLALPRGGVLVAAEVARALRAPMDVFVVRKIGAPGRPDYGIGAIAEDGEPLFDAWAVWALGLSDAELRQLTEAERRECARWVHRYRQARPVPPLGGRSVVVVDDEVTTGVTAEAAVRALRRLVDPPQSAVSVGSAADRAPAPEPHVVVAVPVGARDSLARLQALAEVVCVHSPDEFRAVGVWYEHFRQVGDDEVVALLAGQASA